MLDAGPGGWAVYYSERGHETGRREFATEAEACRHLLALLRAAPTTHFHLVVGPLPAADADAAFDAWKADHDLDDLDPGDIRVDDPVLRQGRMRRYWVRGTQLPG